MVYFFMIRFLLHHPSAANPNGGTEKALTRSDGESAQISDMVAVQARIAIPKAALSLPENVCPGRSRGHILAGQRESRLMPLAITVMAVVTDLHRASPGQPCKFNCIEEILT